MKNHADMIVVGLGPAGCIFLACLPPEKLAGVVAIDRGCIGGDLARLYGNVVANLTRTEIEAAFRKVPAWSQCNFRHLAKYGDTQCPLLADVCLQLRENMAPVLAKITVRFGDVELLQKQGSDWIVGLRHETLVTNKLILCTGATPTQMDLPKSIIPLEVALSLSDLRHFVDPKQRVVVFGTAHSGTLVLRNLKECGCQNVVALYKGAKPFRWRREGDPEGIKQESATIADEIVAGGWGSLTPRLVPVSDTGSMLRELMLADHVVYAMGFESRYPRVVGATLEHNVETGALGEGVWGFGIGFPSRYATPTGTAPDVGFGQFADHILKCMPALL